MATFKPVTRKKRADGLYPVYIRVGHATRQGYIKTPKLVSDKQLHKNGDIKDPVVLEYCAREIRRYTDLINRKDISALSVSELIQYLTETDDDPSFTEYAQYHINKMINTGHERTAKNYRMALQHLQRYLGTTQILFSQLSSTVLRKWFDNLSKTNRAKEMYPICLRQIFRAALLELNDEERGVIRIKFNPWLKVSIPKADKGAQIAIPAEACREFFSHPLPPTKMINPLPELSKDVVKIVLCLGGINTADLYNLKKSDMKGDVIGYKRAKTKHARKDEAYIEMRIEPFIKPVIEKYLAPEDDEYLFNFHSRYCDIDSFNCNVNSGLKAICKNMGMEKQDYYCVYTFRHTWATIAQNDCGANIAEVAFGMNHSNGFGVTRGYIKMDFTPAWDLNAKVIDFIFFSDKKSKQGNARDVEERQNKLFRISKKMMIYARAYFKGKVLAELTDIGFDNVPQVIEALAKRLPDDIPQGCEVQFRITNCDLELDAVYERTKGKGF